MKSIIKEIAEALDGSPLFYSGFKSYQNLQDVEQFPVIYLDEPLTSIDELKQTGYIQAVYQVDMFFGNKTELDNTQLEHDVVINAMRELARQFIIACQNDERIRFIKNAKRTNIINLFDLNLSGCFLTIELTPYNDDGRC